MNFRRSLSPFAALALAAILSLSGCKSSTPPAQNQTAQQPAAAQPAADQSAAAAPASSSAPAPARRLHAVHIGRFQHTAASSPSAASGGRRPS